MSGGRRASESFVGDRHFAITPSNTVNFTDPDPANNAGGQATPIDACVVVLDTTSVTVSLVDTHYTAVTWTVTGPFAIPVRARRVNATGTTATNLVGVW
jgi:hypothetical protein